MEEALMDHKMLRKLVLEQRLINYICDRSMQYPPTLDFWFDCGEEFGICRIYYLGWWWIQWAKDKGVPVPAILVAKCPVNLDDLLKGE